MKSNRIMELPSGVLQGWTQVERLSASFNKLKTLPETISCCLKLVELDLCNNLLEEVPPDLARCRSLQTLNLACNKIQELPAELFQSLAMLKDLQLYKNKISTLPPEVGNLRALSRLSLSSNNLKALPEEIGACVNLKELYINNNAKFSIIPGTAGHLRQLQELSARKCPALKQLPNTLCDMESLRELDVRAAKKQVCKIAPDLSDSLRAQNCIVRGGVVKKAKGGKAGKK
jgi:Leucine-rich repeat (LRR) protein